MSKHRIGTFDDNTIDFEKLSSISKVRGRYIGGQSGYIDEFYYVVDGKEFKYHGHDAKEKRKSLVCMLLNYYENR